tara:strand:+ start:628 stop:867 length:240 start_codon:yes stop_codon:yes gene_type:complete
MYYVLEIIENNQTIWGLNANNINIFYKELLILNSFPNELYSFQFWNKERVIKYYMVTSNIKNIMKYCETFYLFKKTIKN